MRLYIYRRFGEFNNMGEVLEFYGTKKEIITQLSCYMKTSDAKKFFNYYYSVIDPLSNLQNINNEYSNQQNNLCLTTKSRFASKNYNVTNLCINSRVKYYKASKGIRTRKYHTNYTINEKKYRFSLNTALFYLIASALDIVLYNKLGFPCFSKLFEIINALSEYEKSKISIEAQCILIFTDKFKKLPNYSKVYGKNKNCRNMSLTCPHYKEGKCILSKKSYFEAIDFLVNKKYLVLNKSN